MTTELIEAPKTEVGDLALITLDPAKYVAVIYEPFHAKLAAAKAEADKVEFDITTAAGMAIAVKHRAVFRDEIRIASEKIRVDRKAPILMIERLIDLGAKNIKEEAAPYETRFDEAIKAEERRKETEKQAKIEAERARVAAIQKMIGSLRDYPRMILASDPAVLSTTLRAAIDEFDGWTPHVDDYAEFVPEAAAAIAESLAAMRAMLTQAIAKEEAEAKAKAEREAEAARLQAEREELARQRAEVAAKLAQQEREASIERERIAKEQAERDAQAAAQAKAAREAQDAAQAKLDAERAELDRERAEMAEAKRKQEAEEAERVRLQAAADQRLNDSATLTAMPPALPNGMRYSETTFRDDGKPILLNADGTRNIFCDVDEATDPPAATARPSDDEIIQVVAEHFAVDKSLAYGWLIEMQQDLEYL